MTEHGIIDFHSHILPGIDDGSPDVATSLEMLAMSREQGVKVQILTPHYYPWKEDISSFCKRREKSFQILNEKKPEIPKLLYGAEIAYFRHMRKSDLAELCIGNSRALLIEMPFESWQNSIIDDISFLSLDMEYRVVLAHVERFMRYKGNRQKLQEISALPVVFQVNAEAFLHFSTRGTVSDLIRSDYDIILGSDAHNCTSRKPNLGDARTYAEKKFGIGWLEKADECAASILFG